MLTDLADKEAIMTQFLYPETTLCSNVTYGIIGSAILSGKKNMRDLSGHTVIIITNEVIENNVTRALADQILQTGCKNILFCGESSEEMQEIFDEEDREINGFNDITGYEDFAVTKRFEDLEELPDEIEMCWNDVIVLCSDMALLKECKRIVRDIM